MNQNNIVTYVSDVGRHQILIYDKKNIKAPPHCVKLPSEIVRIAKWIM